jgi:hypothetical protein
VRTEAIDWLRRDETKKHGRIGPLEAKWKQQNPNRQRRFTTVRRAIAESGSRVVAQLKESSIVRAAGVSASAVHLNFPAQVLGNDVEEMVN